MRVVLIERSGRFGPGVAYSTQDPQHLLNVPAQGMSAFCDEPSHFLEWSASRLGASAALEALATVSGADKAVKQAIPIIDDFRFGSAYNPQTGKTEPQVTVGKRLTENVRASVSSGLTNDESREIRANLEWRLNHRLSVQGSYDNINDVSSTVGNVGVDLRWRLEFE